MVKGEKFYFIGIGGISMSALARILHAQGKQVCGSDRSRWAITEKLQQVGIEVVCEESEKFVRWCDVCVYTGAISASHPDLLLAKKLGKILLSRAELLALVSAGKKCVSVAGTHGKTTTTAMIGSVLSRSKLCPTIHVGGLMNEINDNVLIGGGEIFLTEACEYKDSFLSLKSFISVILNVEKDHMDYFKNFENLKESFKKFAKNTQNNGYLLINGENKGNFYDCGCNVLIFGTCGNEYFCARNISNYKQGKFQFDFFENDIPLMQVKLPVFGRHNVENAVAAISVCLLLGVKKEVIKDGIESFSGVQRRMQKVSDCPLVFHDYAHHPTEIKASISSLLPLERKITVVFQPHTFSRTRDLYSEFLTCFEGADRVVLLPIYPAREKPIEGISSLQVSLDLAKKGVQSEFYPSFQQCYETLKKAKDDELILLLGAGDIENMTKLF